MSCNSISVNKETYSDIKMCGAVVAHFFYLKGKNYNLG